MEFSFFSEPFLDWNNTFVQRAFEATAQKHPDSIALISRNETFTYQQLDEKAEKLGKLILQQSFTEKIIGVSAARNAESIIAVIAVLKSGKAYLPVDTNLPKERLLYYINDAQIKTCVAPENERVFFESSGTKVITTGEPDENETIDSQPFQQHSLAYILYTSGSTGKPKGVCMGHKPLMNLLHWQAKHSVAKERARTLQFAPLIFDVSFQEIFSTLTTGGTLVLINEELHSDPYLLLQFMEQHQVNRIFLPFVALQLLTDAAAAAGLFPGCLQEVITAGEQLKITPGISNFFKQLPHCRLVNQYGPTECHVVTAFSLPENTETWPVLPSIGKAIDNTEILILDKNHVELSIGETGEIGISGISLAEGYLNLPELTLEKFIRIRRADGSTVRVYLTGDLGRFDNDENIEYLGRKDEQVKIRGYRVEPGEIEVLISQFEEVRRAVVVAVEDASGQTRLVAYLVSSDNEKNTRAIKEKLAAKLPDYMVPTGFVWLDDLPKTSSGKINRNALPKPGSARPDLAVLYKAPKTAIEIHLTGLWEKELGIDKIGVDDNFFELGGSSLLAVKTVGSLKERFNHILPVTKLYQHPTVAQIETFLNEGINQKQSLFSKPDIERNKHEDDIAVIGMAVRFPGINNVSELWEVLKEGKETTTFFSDNELSPFIDPAIKNDPNYIKARGIISKAEEFDAAFFGINPKVAELMDPQQRVFLELAWEVLEQTGHLPQVYDKLTGVYAGSGNNTYYIHNVLANQKLVNNIGDFQVMTLNEKDYIATRTAYELNLKGPAVSVYSACSTSLLAISQAVDGIRKGYCSIAVAGASAINAPIHSGHTYQEGGIMSKDGHCRPFDAKATGTVFSDGAGVVLLKSKKEAEQDGDTIYAVIKGIGVNNDGATKGSFTAPNATGQAGAIAMAIQEAGVQPADISYVETHGTATPLGDPIEIEGLRLAFGQQEKNQFCAIGSIKSNVGHLTAASGIAGFIKTIFCLHYKKLTATLFYNQSNPDIDFINSPFYVNTHFKEWESDKKRIAGVSSFGVGGTNVHIILEEYENKILPSGKSKPFQLVCWSAKSEQSAKLYGQKLASFLKENSTQNLADVAYTLHTTRADFNHRYCTIASANEQIISNFTSADLLSTETNFLQEKPGDIVFLFPGQGAQYLNMGKELYANEPVYKQAIDECAVLLLPYLQTDIRQVIFPENENDEARGKLNNTLYTQPAIFITEYALTQLWKSWGIIPTILCGHSIGELVAAQTAGIFSLPDALKLIACRSKMVSELPGGKMLSIKMEAEKVQILLPQNLSLAAVNSSKTCVVAGPENDIIAFSELLAKREISSKIIQTSHAFHSYMMDPVVEDFYKVVAGLTLHRPQKPVMSTVTGNWLTDAEATDPRYWSDHLRKTVHFAGAVKNILTEENLIFIEAGPGNVTASLTRQQPGGKKATVIASLENKDSQSEYQSVLKALGRLWLNGVAPDWKAFYANEQRRQVSLPTYAFNKKYCWVNPPKVIATDYERKSNEIIKSGEDEIVPPPNIPMRKKVLIEKIKQIIEDASGIETNADSEEISFLEIGLDSLLLTQLAITLKKEFQLPVTFRQLQEESDTILSLATYLDNQLPAGAYLPAAKTNSVRQITPVVTAEKIMVSGNTDQPSLDAINRQLLALTQQMAALQTGQSYTRKPVPEALELKLKENAHLATSGLTPEELTEIKKPFGATPKIERKTIQFNTVQQNFLQNLIISYNKKTAASKAYTQQNRQHMADPRVVSGFSPLTKEITYPIVVNKSSGSKVWDIDGNEYVDALNGFGTNLFGYQPEFLKKALLAQIEKGYELGPQHELCGEVSKMICSFTGFDRAAFCNTGSEAVLGALRIARTVTGRSLVVAFSGSYHGINDEVIVRGTKKLKSFPAASGIMPEAMQNILILDYGTDETLDIIRKRANELAAVLVEPVQSRRPEFTPVEFLQKVREITLHAGTALIFDEVITGFRMHPGGAQALFNIRADLATYGKVIGGGLPIGVIAGKQSFMDALDGGFWKFGDASFPETGVTYFAGTFVRHPLAMATAKATLQYMKHKGSDLQKSISSKAEYLSSKLNAEFNQRGLPLYVARFGSLWKIKFKEEPPLYELIFTLMREKGIHIWDGFPCFITEAHSKEDLDLIISACITSADEMIAAGFYKNKNEVSAPVNQNLQAEEEKYSMNKPRLGRDKDGNPAWFVSDPKQPGRYLQLQSNY